jgi:hypothetical protein
MLRPFFYSLKIDVTFKITVRLKFNNDQFKIPSLSHKLCTNFYDIPVVMACLDENKKQILLATVFGVFLKFGYIIQLIF